MRRVALLLFLSSTLGFTQTSRLTMDDLLSPIGAGRGGAGVLSPDGKYFLTQAHGQIALVPVAGNAAIAPLTSSPAAKAEPGWSPDGQSIVFISEGDLWTMPAQGGVPQRLTHDPVGAGDPRGATDHHPQWNPKGTWILYESGQHGFNELYVVKPDGSGEHALAPAEIYTGRDALGSAAPDHGDAVSSDRFDPAPSWSPDGTRISYTERSRATFSGKLKVLPFNQKTGSAGAAIDLYVAKNDPGGAWAINTAAWSPDSQKLLVVLQQSGWDKLWLLPATGGAPHPITTGTGEDGSPVFSPDGKFIVFLSNRDIPEERHLWVVPATGGSPHRLTHLPGVEAAPQWSPDSQQIYFSSGTALRPPASYVAPASGAGDARSLAPEKPSRFEGLGIIPEVAHFKGKDGLPLAGILYKPANFNPSRRFPTVIWAHGGPEAQVLLSLTPWSLYLAQQGYVVFEPNFRGSTGYGERFRNSNVEDSGGGEIDDIAAAVTYLVSANITDPKRVAIGGGSHGGTVVANAVTKLPDTFAAAIEMFGVVDRALFLQYTNRNSAIRWETKMGGTPEEKPAVYRRANILPDVARIHTPLLIMHGEEDPQVPPQESAEFVAALKKAGKTYSYVTYPHEGHGFQQREHRQDSYERQLAFLALYIRSGDAP